MYASPEAFGSQGLGFGGSPSQATQGRKPREEQKSTCLPVTVRGIETAISGRDDDGELRFWGSEQSMLIVVGAVEGLVKQSASMEFTLNDATGRIKVRHYFSEGMSKDLETLEAGQYICAFGQVRTAPQVHFAATGMRLVTSADEVSFHMIESAHAALRLQNKKTEPVGTPQKVGLGAVGGPVDITPTKMDSTFGMTSPPAEAQSPAAVVSAPKAKLEGAALRSAVLEFVKREGEGNEAGVAITAVRASVDPATIEEVRASLQELVDEGDVFTTLDDDHFAVV